MNQRLLLALAGTLCVGLSFDDATRASDIERRHSLESDYAFMIGHWTCHVTQAGTPDQDMSVEYEWGYDKRVLHENMRLGSKLIGEFLTTYDKTTDRFKGVGVGAWGYVVWENAGFHDRRLSERGFVFDNGKMTPVSRSEFGRSTVSASHSIVRHGRNAATNCSASSQAAWRAVLSNMHQVSAAFAFLTVAAKEPSCASEYFE